MAFYTEASKDIFKDIDKFRKRGEIAKVSEPIKLNNKLYREIEFSKKLGFKLKKQPTGYLYITEQGEIVNQKQIQEKLARLCFYAGVFLDDESETSLINALQSEGDVEKDNRDYAYSKKAVDFFVKEGFEDADKIRTILTKVPELRRKNNERLEEVIDSVNKYKEEEKYFNEDLFLKLQESYREILRLNFEKVKLIASGKEYYDYLKKKAEKTRKKLSIRFNTKITTPLMRLDYVISYFRRIIRTYSSIIDMSTSQYMKHLASIEKQHVNNRIKLLRK